jgi:hypothetical protein
MHTSSLCQHITFINNKLTSSPTGCVKIAKKVLGKYVLLISGRELFALAIMLRAFIREETVSVTATLLMQLLILFCVSVFLNHTRRISKDTERPVLFRSTFFTINLMQITPHSTLYCVS